MENLKRYKSIIGILLGLLLVFGCKGGTAKAPGAEASIATNTTAPLLATPNPTDTPPPTNTSIPPTATPDTCAGATTSGAREKFSFTEIVSCLDTPEKLVLFMSSNLIWDGAWDNSQYGDNTYSPAGEVYELGTDDCDGLAEFAACVLSKHGYEAYNVGISILGPSGHNVTGYVGKDDLKYSIHNGEIIHGPFNTWEELAQFYIDQGSASPPGGVIWLFSPCIPSRAVGDAVLALPYKVIR
jgi:hypothetical protein